MKDMNEKTRGSRPDGASVTGTLPGMGQLVRRVFHGDIGSLPVLIGLILIGIIFQIANPNFLTPLNLTNLLVQIAATGTISVGIVLILLIGEIDLSVGTVSGLCGAVMAVLSVKVGLPGIVAVLSGVLAGTLIGLFQGWWIARLHVPSFVVTLAGQLGWLGVLLWVLGSTGTINLSDPFITGIVNMRIPVWIGWLIGGAVVLFYVLSSFASQLRRSRNGLQAELGPLMVLRILIVSALVLAAIWMMSVNRNPRRDLPIAGVPMGVVILMAVIILFDLITRRTQFGRYVFAVGGSAEAARRAGINVNRIRIAVFALGSTLAATGGVLAGSRLFAVNQSSGGGDILLNAIAAAVIGGTSLFGGRGSTWSALLGALVIGSISNGMDLLAFSSSVRFMITGAVLLLAVTLDSYTRARRERTGD
jgi:D-xylose transport system permease protein